MTNYFALLELPESLSVDPALIEQSWRSKSRSLSAENGSNHEGTADTRDLNQARATLADPALRLGHWLAIKAPSLSPDRSIDPPLMDLFAGISPVLAATDSLLSRHRKATTALTRAMLTKEAIDAQLKIQDLLQRIQPLKAAIIGQFDAFEENAATGIYQGASKGLGQLKFLKRWEEQCRERLLSLIEC